MPNLDTGYIPAGSTGLVPLGETVHGGKYPAMQKATNQAILERINFRLREMRLTPQRASKAAKLGPDTIRDLERRPEVLPRLDTLEALAPILETTPEWLAFGIGGEGGSALAGGVPVIGEVAAGLWFDVEEVDVPKFSQYPIPADLRYPAAAQFGLVVRGSSINRIAKEGEVLHCIDIGITAIEPENDDLVIVERRRAQGSQKEVTAKRVSRKGGMIRLSPDSDDDRWKTPLVLDPKKASDDEEILIVALVIGVYKPLRR